MTTFNVLEECRACLRQLGEEKRHQLFDPWPPSAPRCGILLANDLATLANIQILETDNHSKVLCVDCYKKLKDSWTFIATVKHTDSLLNKIPLCKLENGSTSWPQPIDVNLQISGAIDNVEVEVKQEVLSEDENAEPMDTWEPTLDIKIEPEEITAPDQFNIYVNGGISHKEQNEDGPCINGVKEYYSDEEYLENAVKQEPLSEGEDINHEPSSQECILCMKQFYTISGLKTHVIAQHSYKTVRRKSNAPPTNTVREHICVTCRKTFASRAELTAHESEHWEHTCLVCRASFRTFTMLSRHLCRGTQLSPALRTYAKHSPKSRAKFNDTSENIAPKTELSSLFDVTSTKATDNSTADDIIKKMDDTANDDADKSNNTVEISVESLDSCLEALLETKTEINEDYEADNNIEENVTGDSESPSIEHNKENVAMENMNVENIKQNMEVLVAINPIEQDSVILDSKLIVASEKKLESDNLEPKIVSVSETPEGNL